MIIVDWSNIINEEEIDIELSKHGQDRSKFRYGQYLDIKKEDIENLIKKSSDVLLKYANQFETFVVHGIKSKLNVVGALLKKGSNWIFKVITVMFKDHFYPKNDDKFIEVYEHNGYKILGEKINKMKHLKTLDEFIIEKGTESYPPPEYIVQPAKDDKVYFYMEDELEDSPNWGHEFDEQEDENKKIRK